MESSRKMSTPVVDVHQHLGDILREGGARHIYDDLVGAINLTGPRRTWRELLDYGHWRARNQYRQRPKLGAMLERVKHHWMVFCEHRRLRAATHRNLISTMDETGVDFGCVLSVAPNVSFGDLKGCDPTRMARGTSVDFEADRSIEGALEADLAEGARLLKVHPNLQRKRLNSIEVKRSVAAFSESGLPVLLHVGYNQYHHNLDHSKERPEYGDNIDEVVELVNAFPYQTFIIGHAGLGQVREVIRKLSMYPNVNVDISFQSPEMIKRLIDAFGPERVLFGSDWPYGGIRTAKRNVNEACEGDEENRAKILGVNAAQLLKLQMPLSTWVARNTLPN